MDATSPIHSVQHKSIEQRTSLHPFVFFAHVFLLIKLYTVLKYDMITRPNPFLLSHTEAEDRRKQLEQQTLHTL